MRGRVLGIDVGERRVGLAISDPSGTLARPLETLMVSGSANAVDRVVEAIARLFAEDDGLAAIVVGVPLRLDGSKTKQTANVVAFIDALKARTKLTVATEGEQLSSREAESRLAVRERDWRGLLHYGVIFFLLEKLAAVVGVSNLHVYAAMRGQSLAEFQKTRSAPSALYSVAGTEQAKPAWSAAGEEPAA